MFGAMGHAGPQGVCGVVIVRVCNTRGFLVFVLFEQYFFALTFSYFF